MCAANKHCISLYSLVAELCHHFAIFDPCILGDAQNRIS